MLQVPEKHIQSRDQKGHSYNQEELNKNNNGKEIKEYIEASAEMRKYISMDWLTKGIIVETGKTMSLPEYMLNFFLA